MSLDSAKKLLYLSFSEESVQAHLVDFSGVSPTIIEHSPQLQFGDTQSALLRTDECLQQLGAESESINEVILGLDPDWVQHGEISAEKKPLLKNILTELSLKPLGFISFTESLVQLHAVKDPTLSAVLVYVSEKNITLTHFDKGVAKQTESVGRSDRVATDVLEGLARFEAGKAEGAHLPSTMLLASFALSDEQLTGVQQELFKYPWAETKLFLQTPVITLIPQQEVIHSIALEAKTALFADQETQAETQSYDQLKATNREQTEQVTQPDSFGKLISNDADDPAKTAQEELSPSHFSKRHLRLSVFVGVVAGIAALVALVVAAAFFFTTATTSITLERKPVSETIQIKLDPEATTTNAAERTLAATVITEEFSGEGSAQTTGVKIVGEKATGDVLIYNKTTAEKTFQAGTTLSSGTLQYTLTGSVTVPAASVQQTGAREVKDYGQATGKVEAVVIGDESNKPEKTELVIGSFALDTYSAVTSTALSGGSSREVRVVSQQDRAELQKEVLRKVLDEANESFKARSKKGETYILPTKDIAVKDVQFDAAVEVEANTLRVSLTAVVSALSYATKDIRPIAEVALATKIPDGYSLVADDPQVLSAPTQQLESSSESVTLEVNITSYAIAAEQQDLWKTAIAGKSLSESEQYLTNLEEIATAKVSLNPIFIARLYPRVPTTHDRIVVTVSPEKEQ